MRTAVVAALMMFGSAVVAAAEGPVMFHVTVKGDGGLVESDGGAWTQVRITYFETPTSRFVQEMATLNKHGLRTGSFEYTDPTNRRYLIKVGGQRP
jgi:hypothetical protein